MPNPLTYRAVAEQFSTFSQLRGAFATYADLRPADVERSASQDDAEHDRDGA